MEKGINNDVTYLTQREVADRFRVTQSTVKNWRERGLLAYFQALGSTRVLYPVIAVEQFEQQSIKQKKGVVKLTEIKRKRPRIPARPEKEWRLK
jgi:DNA-binding transcriptional MerR regulator